MFVETTVLDQIIIEQINNSLLLADSTHLKAIKTVVKHVLSTYFEIDELHVLIGMFELTFGKKLDPRDLQEEDLANKADALVEDSSRDGYLTELINQIRVVRPHIWKERIWPLILPRVYLPQEGSFFVGRYKQIVDLQEQLVGESNTDKFSLIIIKGVHGIGKTALSLHVAHLSRKHGNYDGIFWIMIHGKRLQYAWDFFEWPGWLRSLNYSLGWNIHLQGDLDETEFYEQSWNRLKNGRYLLFVDGLDDLDGHDVLLDFLSSLGYENCKVVVNTTLNLQFDKAHTLSLRGLNEEECTLWLRKAATYWNIKELLEASEKRLLKCHKVTGGLPMALHWHVAQMTSEQHVDPELKGLKEIPSEEFLLDRIFDSSFRFLSIEGQNAILALSIFDWSVSEPAWQSTAGLKSREFGKITQELTKLALIEHDPQQQRFSLPPIVRAFAKVKLLKDSQLETAMVQNWLKYFEGFCKQYSRRGYEGFATIEREWPNLWQAIEYVLGKWDTYGLERSLHKEREQWGLFLISFANGVSEFCRIRGYREERLIVCTKAAEAANALNLPKLFVPLAYTVGWMWCSRRNFRAANAWEAQATETSRNLGEGSGYPLRLAARIERLRLEDSLEQEPGSAHKTKDLLNEAKEIFDREHDNQGLARILSDEGVLLCDIGQYDEALQKYKEAFELFQAFGDQENAAGALVNRGDVYLKKKQFGNAHQYYSMALKEAGASEVVEIVAEAERGLAEAMIGTLPNTPKLARNLILKQALIHANSAHLAFVHLGLVDMAERTVKLTKTISDFPPGGMEAGISKEGIQGMTPEDTIAVNVLVEGTKFLFGELGRRLAFWQEKKGDNNPESIEEAAVVEKEDGIYLQIDDLQQQISVNDMKHIRGQVNTSLDIIRKHNITKNTYRIEQTDPTLSVKEKAFLNQKIDELDELIKQEGDLLQKALEKAVQSKEK